MSFIATLPKDTVTTAQNGRGSQPPRTVFPSGKAVSTPASVASLYDRWVADLAARFDDPAQDNNNIVRDTLAELFYGSIDAGGRVIEDLTLTGQIAAASLDPRNVTLEPEYYNDVDVERYAARKPFIWLWLQFDRSPQGWNLDLGFRLKRLLAPRIFKRVGENLKVFPYVEFSFGYNLSLGDDVTLHRNVLLDDRGEIIIGNRASISDYAQVFSHSHDPHDIRLVTLGRTEIGEGARVTYHSTVLSGARVGDNAILGAHGLATKAIADNAIAVGLPAKPIRTKEKGGLANRPSTRDSK